MTKRVKDDLEKHTVLKQKKGRLKYMFILQTRQSKMEQWKRITKSVLVKALAITFFGFAGTGAAAFTGQTEISVQNNQAESTYTTKINLKSILKNYRKALSIKNSIYKVGSLPGKLNITPTGAATYSIPIQIAPGTAGIAPKLAIKYNSQKGNGILGMGFTLQGLTAITREPQTKAQNGKTHGVNYTNEDRFSLNGQQLVATSGTYGGNGTEYRTYIASQTKIKSYGQQGNGPEKFEAWSKGGEKATYGYQKDSRILAQGKSTVSTWALDKIEDTAGNYMEIHYDNDTVDGAFYPSEIDYTGNEGAGIKPYNKVKFIYQTRPDVITKWRAGSKSVINKRLAEIQIYTEGKLSYAYKIRYDQSPNTNRSRIISI